MQKLRCMNLLKSRDYTVYQLKTKLKENGYPEFLIDTAIEYVASYGYVDDEKIYESLYRICVRYKEQESDYE